MKWRFKKLEVRLIGKYGKYEIDRGFISLKRRPCKSRCRTTSCPARRYRFNVRLTPNFCFCELSGSSAGVLLKRKRQISAVRRRGRTFRVFRDEKRFTGGGGGSRKLERSVSSMTDMSVFDVTHNNDGISPPSICCRRRRRFVSR